MANAKQAVSGTDAREPEGHLLSGGMSFSKMNPIAGKLAQRGTPTCCGWIAGIVMATVQESGTEYGPYTRFIGDFLVVKHPTREEVNATELYLPRAAERFVNAAFATHGPGCPIRFEVWAVPDGDESASRPKGVGWKYAVYLRQPPGMISAARKLAIESGMVEAPPAPPPQQIQGPADGHYDPETGEVLVDAAE